MLKRFTPILLLTFVNVIGFSLLFPILPDIVARYADPKFSGVAYGFLVASYSLFQLLGAPLLGSLSDKYGRKPILLISQLGTLLSWVVFGAAYFVPDVQLPGFTLPLLIIALSRVTDGITGGNISVANAWVSDMTTREERTKAFGLIGAVFGLGFMFGPALGGLSASTSIGYLGTCIAAFLVSLITLAFIYFYLPESLPEDKRDHELHISLRNELNVPGKIALFRGNRFVFDLLIVRLFFALVFATYTTILTLYLSIEFGMDTTALGLTMSVVGIFSVFNQAVVARKFSEWIGDLKTVYASMALIFVGMVTLPLVPTGLGSFALGPISISLSFLVFLVNAYIMIMGVAIGMPAFKTLLTSHVSEKQQGLITGLDESLLALGRGTTPIIAGGLYTTIGGATFWAFAGLLAVPFLYLKLADGRFLLQDPLEKSADSAR